MKHHSGNKFKVIGAMSGTSCDGLDLAACEFLEENNKWKFKVVAAETIEYTQDWLKKLQNTPFLSGEKIMELHAEYGNFTGLQINALIKKTGFLPDLISSHGHTIFHQPEKHFTFQLGNGAQIAATTNITTVSDFRTGDVALGGQGAPLVPIGDRILFSEYDYCLNLGGFANISFEEENKRIAFDICPVNFILNFLAKKQGFPFDKNGELGRCGTISHELLAKLNNIEYYKTTAPKSLGREWVETAFSPVMNSVNISDKDLFSTVYEHIATQISKSITKPGKVLITGGGAFNTFLIELISEKTPVELVIPANEIVNFKEALIFAFLGILKIKGQINCLSSVTGASRDSSSGIIHLI
jgi:anhydro-N-acetylmuramic acid kinase